MRVNDTSLLRRTALAAVIVALSLAAGGARLSAQGSDLQRIVEALGVRAGAVVAEIGAGDGELTVQMAKAVGEQGRVFSNEVSAARVEAIRGKVREAGVGNVTVVAGRDDGTNLPDECCDGVFMNDVYHHFAKPAAMNASILRALKPGGKLVVLDFGPPPGAESSDPAGRDEDGRHGITPATLESELRAAGFEVLRTEQYGFRSSMTVARRGVGSN